MFSQSPECTLISPHYSVNQSQSVIYQFCSSDVSLDLSLSVSVVWYYICIMVNNSPQSLVKIKGFDRYDHCIP